MENFYNSIVKTMKWTIPPLFIVPFNSGFDSDRSKDDRFRLWVYLKRSAKKSGFNRKVIDPKRFWGVLQTKFELNSSMDKNHLNLESDAHRWLMREKDRASVVVYQDYT